MSKQQLTELLIKGDKPFESKQQTWFNRYNHVVDVYNSMNQDCNKLEKMYCPYRSYNFVSLLINNYLFNIAIVLVFTFLPIFNMALISLVISYTVFLKSQTKKHQENIKISPDPFQTFYFYPEMCQQLCKHFTTLKLTVEEIENFKFNETHDRIRQNLVDSQENSLEKTEKEKEHKQTSQGKKKYVKVPIYDQYFYDSFFLVCKEYYKAISWSILGVALLGLSFLFYYAIFEDFLT